MKGEMTSGFGQFHTDEPGKKNRKPYGIITLSEIRYLVDNPQQVDKERALWVIPSSYKSRRFKVQEELGEYWMLWADLDKEPKPIADTHNLLNTMLNNCEHEIYTSRSATSHNQKARILIPLDKALCFADWVIAQEILNDKLESAGINPDRSNQRAAQLCYLPNRGAFYDMKHNRFGFKFDPISAWVDECEDKRRALEDKQATLEVNKIAAMERRDALKINGSTDAIGAFNSAYSVHEILLNAGYEQRGDTFRHPASESGSFSASVRDGRVHTLSTSDPLYTAGTGAHDAFSAFTVLVHKGDHHSALKDAGDNLLSIDGEPWNRVKQREYMQGMGKIEFENLNVLAELPSNSEEIPFDIESPPGLAGNIADYIFKSSRIPVRSFAIAGALTAISYLSENQWYVKSSDTPLNIYQTLIGDTGRGKEDPRKAIKRLADAVFKTDGIRESLSSGPALLRSLESNKVLLVMLDEFGIFLQAALSDKGSVHLKELIKELLTMFGMGRSFFAGKSYANIKDNIGKINKPFINLLATTTQLELMDGITSKSVDNGFLNRFLFIKASEENPINRNPIIEVPKTLVDNMPSFQFGGENTGLTYADGAENLMVTLAAQMVGRGEYANLWSRAEEQMIRVSGLLAIGDGGIIKSEHIVWAHRYVSWCISAFAASLGSELAETSFERKIVKARKLIKNAINYSSDRQFGKWCKLGYMPRGKLVKLMKIPARELDDVVAHLTASEQVITAKHENVSILYMPN